MPFAKGAKATPTYFRARSGALCFRRTMRIFDEEEKGIIDKILRGQGYARSFINLLDSQKNLQGTRISIDKANKKACFLFQTQDREPNGHECSEGIEKQKQLTELIIKYLTLLRYLEKEELAVFFDTAKSDEAIVEFGRGAVNMPSFSMSIDDETVVDLLIKYVHKEIMPSPSLRVLEKNKYIPDEERRFIWQQRAAWAAIGLSLLLGLYGVFSNFQKDWAQEKRLNSQIQENLILVDSVIKKIDAVQASNIDYGPAIKEATRELVKACDRLATTQKKGVGKSEK
jgi:hypothetical protein